MTGIEAVISIITALAAFVGAVAGISAWLKVQPERDKLDAEAHKAKAEARKADAEASAVLISELQEEREWLKDQVCALRKQVDNCLEEHGALDETLQLAMKRIAELEEQNGGLLQRVNELEREVAQWRQAYESLCAWVREQGLEPPSEWGG